MIQSKTVDITPMKITLPVIEMSQYDLGRQVIVHMKDGSDWFDLTGYTAKLQGTKPSGFGYTVDGVVDGHDITFASNYDMTSEAGFIPSEVRLTKNGVSLGSLNVILRVEKTPHDVSVTDGSPETIIPEMTELVERAEAAAEVLLDCSAIATTLPAGSNATASYDVESGVFTFGIPRGNKGETGDTGVGISSITKTGTSGLVDTYTITYTDSSTSTFTVTNGDDGDDGVGIRSITKTGTSGLVDTYTITYTNGTTTTFQVTNGQNGTGSVSDVWQNGVSVLDGNTAKVVVPTKTSDLTNDSGFVTSVPTKTSDLTNDSNFVADSSYVHTDNNFTTTLKNKLNGIASGAEVNVQSDWNATSGDALILNKPTIPTVPTNVSAFTNDAGYLTSYTETDPVFSASPAHGITSSNISSWNSKATASGITATLAVADWANNTQTITATGVTASNNVIVSPAPSSVTDYVAAGIVCTAQASNSLTFTCTTTPSTAISVNVLVVS